MNERKRIAISIGHEEARQGAHHGESGLTEFEFSKKAVPIMKRILTERGHHVLLITANNLRSRISIINAAQSMEGKYDIAVETHLNADYDHTDPHDKNDMRGYGCMVMHYPKSRKRKEQAQVMSDVISERLDVRNLGAREGWYWGNVEAGKKPTNPDGFLKYVRCPSFIFEAGFIDNNKFYRNHLSDDDKIYEVALFMSDAVSKYLEDFT